MTKATPDNRRNIHENLVHSQITSVKKPSKIHGFESNKASNYNASPVKYENRVLEQRVFKTPKQSKSVGKKRA